jgi:alpha-galactosidase
MSQTDALSNSRPSSSDATAVQIPGEIQLNAASPAPEWEKANPITFCADWKGVNPEPERQTRVRLLWTIHTLYLRFECRYVSLHVFDDSDPDGRRHQLWDRDVAEVFLQPDPERERYYKEFEVAPNGMWIDLDISPGPLRNLQSGMQRSVWLNPSSQIWCAELAIPMRSLTATFDQDNVWRVNFYRVEGSQEPRAYLAWQPTHTPQPNFHVPTAFGKLRFASQSKS